MLVEIYEVLLCFHSSKNLPQVHSAPIGVIPREADVAIDLPLTGPGTFVISDSTTGKDVH
jgi:hypothetical protein